MSEFIITANIALRTALHIGGNGGDEVSDDLLRRDTTGRVFLPGSAIAGPLRALATRLTPRLFGTICQALNGGNEICSCPVCRLFGAINPDEGGEQGGYASQLWCDDAHPCGHLSIRDGVGIDRATGASARQGAVKFDTEVLIPANEPFSLRLTLHSVADAEVQRRNEELLSLILHEWQAGRGTLGGKVGRGLGAFQLTQLEWYQRDLRDTTSLMSFLQREDDDAQAGATQLLDHQSPLLARACAMPIIPAPAGDRTCDWSAYAVARSWTQLDLTLAFEGPMLINDLVMARRSGFDHAPLGRTSGAPDSWALPGASLRGVLRSHAERIARTLATGLSADLDEFRRRCPAGDPNNSRYPDRPLANSDCLLKEREQKPVDGKRTPPDDRTPPSDLDLGDRLFGSVRLGSRLLVEDGTLVGLPVFKALDFLAIDRFTGGGRDSAKFDAMTLWKPTFRTRLRIENPEVWELGWLLLTLRDLHAGLTGIGFGQSKGFGRVHIANWSLRIGYLDAADCTALSIPHELGTQDESPSDGIWRMISIAGAKSPDSTQVRSIAQAWINAFNTHIVSFMRNDTQGVPLQHVDTYFGQLEAIYPRAEG